MTGAIIGFVMCAAAGWLLYAIRYRATEPQPKLLQSDVVAYTLCLVCIFLVAGGVAMIVRGMLMG
ncbi:MAG: hypothetical protein Q8M19_13785 [Reyranella sp.]|nr:hypothetical protein [Reyranella sp.]